MLSKYFLLNKERDVITSENMEEFVKFKEKNKQIKIIGTHSRDFH